MIKDKNIQKILWIVVIALVLLLTGTAVFGQLDITKRTVTLDSIGMRQDTLWIVDGAGSVSYMLTSDDTLHFDNAKIKSLSIGGGPVVDSTKTLYDLMDSTLIDTSIYVGTIRASSSSYGNSFTVLGGGSPAMLIYGENENHTIQIIKANSTTGSAILINHSIAATPAINIVTGNGYGAPLHLEERSAAPPSPQPGDIYYNSSGHFYGWNGTSWLQLDN